MKKFGLAVLSVALLTGTAYSADLIIDSPAPEEMAPMSYDSAMYVSIFGGAAMINDFDFESSVGPSGTVSFDTGYSVDAALGFNLGSGLSLEGQIGYLNAALNDGDYNNIALDPDGNASVTYAMVNAWYGFDMGGLTPFIGGGVGAASVSLNSDFAGVPGSGIDDSETTWAAQIGAGISVDIAENIALVGRYRYLATGEVSLTDAADDENTGSASANIVDIGLKISF